LGWRQSEFEAVVQKVEEQMLKEGFNREEIRKMKDEGRKKRPRNKAILGSVFLSRKTMI
jgi:hypothetical protein